MSMRSWWRQVNADADVIVQHRLAGDVKLAGSWYHQDQDLNLLPIEERERVFAAIDRENQAAARSQQVQQQRQAFHQQRDGWQAPQQRHQAVQDGARHASVPTYAIGSQYSADATYHPSTGRQNGTRVTNAGVYEGTYTNRGVFTYDPNGVSILAEDS